MNEPAEKINVPAARPRQLRRAWTARRKAKVVKYFLRHGSAATQKQFRVSGSMLYRWRDESEVGKVIMKKKSKLKKHRRLKTISHPHGMGPLTKTNPPAKTNVHDAIVYLEHAEQWAHASGKQWTMAELYALLALRTLKGEG